MMHYPHKFRLPLLFFILFAFVFLLGGFWSVMAQDDVLPLPGSQNGRTFAQIQQLTASDAAANDSFGWSVALDNDFLVEGNFYPDDFAGAAYIFERNTSGVWNEITRLAGNDTLTGDAFGYDVALQATTAVIGAPNHNHANDNDGAVYIFTRDTTGAWTQQQKLVQPGLPDDSLFGSAVDIEGDRIVIAAQGANAAYVYQRNSSQLWQYETELTVEDKIYDIAIDDEYILIGTPYDDAYDFGAAYLYQLVGGSWTLAQKLQPEDAASLDRFGFRVALEGAQAFVVSRIYTGSSRGSVYVFSPDGDEWSQSQKLTPNDLADGDYFGQAIALDQQKMAVGSFGDGGGAGSVYLFGWNGSGWVQQEKIAAVGDYFGYSVDLQAEVLVSGAITANSSEGKVYVYSDPDLLPTPTPTITNTPPAEEPLELLIDGGFEANAAGWTIKNATHDKVKCNKTDKIFAYQGVCAWRFKGSEGENTKIQQIITTGVAVGDTLILSGYVSASGAVDGKVKVVVLYLDTSLEKSKVVVNISNETAGTYSPLSISPSQLKIEVAAPVEKIKVQVKNSSTSGKVYYDALSLTAQ
jgi:hypothetical protein